MPPITPKTKVLVTGASGFLGAHIIKVLLDNGFSVRGTVRSDAKGQHLKKTFSAGDFEYVLVPDIVTKGAFDEAVRGVEGIIHTATPVDFGPGEPSLTIEPAIAGTVGILESSKAYEPQLKRIIIISSGAAVASQVEAGYRMTEKDWNDKAVEISREHGASMPGLNYVASKVLAERAAWEFLDSNKDALGYDMITVCPPWIFGPAVDKSEQLNGSNQWLLGNLKSEHSDSNRIAREGAFVDVRDLSTILVDLLGHKQAGNERFLVSAGEFSWQDMYDVINKDPVIPGFSTGVPGTSIGPNYDIVYDASKLQTLLGVPFERTYRPLSATAKDMLNQLGAMNGATQTT